MPLKSHVQLATIAVLATLAVACAKPRATGSVSDRTEPPELLTRGAFPILTATGANTGGPLPRLRVQVIVDSLGRADVSTLKLIGVGAGAENRAAIERWLGAVTFRPAMRNGKPVAGMFEVQLEVRIIRRPY